MSIKAASCPGWKRITVLLLSVLLYDCSTLPPEPSAPPKPRHIQHKTVKPKPEPEPAIPALDPVFFYPAGAYVLHLSLAELTLEAGGNETSAAAADFDIARAYSSQKQSDVALQPAIIFEFMLKEHKTNQIILIPFTMPQQTSEFPALKDIMNRLSGLSYTVYDLRPAVLRIPPQAQLGNEGNSQEAAEKMANDILRPLAKNAVSMPPMAQARVELQLARFFMKHNYREPAYLAIENARQSLATVDVSAGGDSSQSVRNLSREIDVQETLLHKTMPYTF